MKPLTIEQLKALEVGDWVWRVYPNAIGFSTYIQKIENNGDYFYVSRYKEAECKLLYATYGTKWLAYKNKEQAEGADFEDKYYALKAAIVEVCDKLDNKKYNDDFYKITLGSKIQRIEEIEAQKLAEREEKLRYEGVVREFNCAHADEHGVCELLSDNSAKNYCPLSPCKDYKEKSK